MGIIPGRTAPIRPTPTYGYFDRIQVWLRIPVDRASLPSLREQCGAGKIHPENRPARFDARFRQRLDFKQPTRKALEWIAGCAPKSGATSKQASSASLTPKIYKTAYANFDYEKIRLGGRGQPFVPYQERHCDAIRR